jgi:head-tail adaptor
MKRAPVLAGRLRWVAIIEKPTASRSSATGAEVITWAPLATVRVQLMESATATDESLQNGVDTFARPSRVRMRYRSDLDATMRLNLGGGRLLQIIGTAELGYRQGTELACKEWAHT